MPVAVSACISCMSPAFIVDDSQRTAESYVDT